MIRLVARTLILVVALAVTLLPANAQRPSIDGSAQAPGRTTTPRLVVLLVIDQFRTDYVDMYGKQWSHGLKEIFDKGAFFTKAAYPYGVTKTCVGHFTIGTGTLPMTHGMIDNEWFDAKAHDYTTCTEDPEAQAIIFGGGRSTEHHSARLSLAPAFADELQRQQRRPARVVSLSFKARSAIGMGGHGGPNSTIVWEDDTGGRWATSTALTKRASPEVMDFIKSHPVEPGELPVWDRILPAASYQYADRAPGEPAASGVFPHSLITGIRTSKLSAVYTDLWDRTPFMDEYLGDMGMYLADQLKLGQRDATDMLAIGFSGLDVVGHVYGPRSHEVQDTLARLDLTIGKILELLDKSVGRDHYVLALSADHGVALLPEQVEPAGSVGRVDPLSVGNAVELAIRTAVGPGRYVEAISSPYVYFFPGVIERIRQNPALVKAIETAALGAKGIGSVYWSADLASTSPTTDRLLTAMRKGYVAGRSGDLAFIPRQNWIVATTGTTHGTPWEYDQDVPVVFLGAGITTGRFTSAATPADIAPTLGALTHVNLPHPDGHVLTEAIAK